MRKSEEYFRTQKTRKNCKRIEEEDRIKLQGNGKGHECISIFLMFYKTLPSRKNALKLKKVAILGGNAKALVLSGGGSASLKPSYFVSPYDGIAIALGENVEVTYCEGAQSK